MPIHCITLCLEETLLRTIISPQEIPLLRLKMAYLHRN